MELGVKQAKSGARLAVWDSWRSLASKMYYLDDACTVSWIQTKRPALLPGKWINFEEKWPPKRKKGNIPPGLRSASPFPQRCVLTSPSTDLTLAPWPRIPTQSSRWAALGGVPPPTPRPQPLHTPAPVGSRPRVPESSARPLSGPEPPRLQWQLRGPDFCPSAASPEVWTAATVVGAGSSAPP